MCIIIFRINKKSIISRNTYEWQKLYWYKNGQKKLTAFWTYFLLTRLSSLSSDNFWCPWRQGNSIRSTIRRVLCSSLFEWRMWVVAVPTWTLTFSSPLFLVPSCICSLLKTICRLPQMEQSMDQHFLCDQMSTVYQLFFFVFFSFNTTPDWIISAPWSLHHCSFQQTKHGGLRKQERKSSSELSVAAYMAFLVLIKLVDLSRYEGYDLVDRTAFERRGRTVTWNHVSGLVLRSCSGTGTFYTCGLVHYGKSGNQYSESALDLMKWRQLGVESLSVIATPRARLRPFPTHTKPFGVIAV